MLKKMNFTEIEKDKNLKIKPSCTHILIMLDVRDDHLC